jgi:hypothetical protein
MDLLKSLFVLEFADEGGCVSSDNLEEKKKESSEFLDKEWEMDFHQARVDSLKYHPYAKSNDLRWVYPLFIVCVLFFGGLLVWSIFADKL